MTDAERIVLVKWSPALAAGALAVTALFWLVPLGYLIAGSYTGSDLILRRIGIYLSPGASGDQRLRGDWQPVGAPAPGLSDGCYRYTVSPYSDAGARIEAAVRRHRPQVWLGPVLHD